MFQGLFPTRTTPHPGDKENSLKKSPVSGLSEPQLASLREGEDGRRGLWLRRARWSTLAPEIRGPAQPTAVFPDLAGSQRPTNSTPFPSGHLVVLAGLFMNPPSSSPRGPQRLQVRPGSSFVGGGILSSLFLKLLLQVSAKGRFFFQTC